MYDSFEPFMKLNFTNFNFKSQKYDMWQSGSIVKSEEVETDINAIVINVNGVEQTKVIVNNEKLKDQINRESYFDIFVTSNDRLMLLTLPQKSNTQSAAIQILSFNYGITRKTMHFSYNDPYGCQLFLMNNKISMISFIFSNPERLIEFHGITKYKLNFYKNFLKPAHLPIINFFKKNGFGTINPVLTYLSILSPNDRCCILEELYNPDTINSVLNDKLLLAYVTNGRKDLAEKVITNALINGERQENIYFLRDKLDLGLAPQRTGQERIILYEDFKRRNNDEIELEFLNILITFCKLVY